MVCDLVLFKLLRLRPVDVTQVHIVPTLELLLLAVGVRHGAVDVLHV